MNELREVLRKKINELKLELERSTYDASYEKQLEVLNTVINNPDLVNDNNLGEVTSVLSGLDLDDSTKNDMTNSLKALVFLNGGSHLGIKMTDEELSSILSGVGKVRDDISARKSTKTEKLDEMKQKIAAISTIDKQIRENDYVDNIDLVLELTRGLSSKEQLVIFQKLYDHNHSIRMDMQEELIDFENDYNYESLPDRVDIKSVQDIFVKYGYDISYLDPKYIEIIKKRGSTDRIIEVLDTLRDYSLSFNIEDLGYQKAFMSLIIKGDRATMTKSFEIAKENNLDPKKLISLTSSLIKQRKYVSRKTPENTEGPGPLLESGFATNFQKNVELFKKELFNEELGWDLPKVFKKCSTVLVQPYEIVEKNLMLMKYYGIDLRFENKNCLSILRTLDFAEKFDRYLEIDDDATFYIRNNLSRLLLPDLIYKLQYLAKNRKNGVIYDPYRVRDSITGLGKQLKGEVTNPDLPGRQVPVFLKDSIEVLSEIMGIVNLSDKIENYSLYEAELDKNNANYEFDDSLLERPEIMNLETNYRVNGDPLVYDLNGVRISRLKALRIYQTFMDSSTVKADDNALLFAVTHNSLLDENEFAKVEKTLGIKSKVMK